LKGDFDLVVFMTGVGVRAMLDIAQTRFDREELLAALRKVRLPLVGRSPLQHCAILKVPVHVTSEEPSTWHELLHAIDVEYGDSLGEMSVAVQEYGASNPELLAELSGRSRELTKVPVYQWALLRTCSTT